jgi:hypothetical protein
MIRPCEVEENFQSGNTSEGCRWMWAHPLQTIRIEQLCHKCEVSKASQSYKIAELKANLQKLREALMETGRTTRTDDALRVSTESESSTSPASQL